MSYKLPKPYLSYSALSLWERDREQFRRRYYEGKKMPDTPYTLFGKEVHEKIENSDDFADVPQYSQSEIELSTTIDGIVILGYIDSFCPDCMSFIDYKSGIRKRDGSPRWTELDTHKTDQLPFYSMLIEENYKDTPKEHSSKLVWLETAWGNPTYKKGSEILIEENATLDLTGYYEVFDRVIEPWERDRIRTWISEKADEISEDYRRYLAMH